MKPDADMRDRRKRPQVLRPGGEEAGRGDVTMAGAWVIGAWVIGVPVAAWPTPETVWPAPSASTAEDSAGVSRRTGHWCPCGVPVRQEGGMGMGVGIQLQPGAVIDEARC